MSATPLKKKATSKGLFKLKPKGGCRTLSQQLKDYTTIATILLLTAVLGRYLQAQKLAEEEAQVHGEQGAHRSLEEAVELPDPRRELHGHHHFDPMLDMQATLGICVVLITVTIFFEMVKHKLEHDVPPMMAPVLQAMFGELTVLGFIALYAYFMLRLGVLGWVSMLVYGDDEHLIHLFEDIHFMLFFVMILFLIEAVILVLASLKSESYWMRVEGLISGFRREGESRASFAPVVAQLLVTYKAGKADCCRRFCLPRLLWSYREAEAREELRYALIRDRFIAPAAGAVAQATLPADFEFSGYLRREMAHMVAHALHVSTGTWLVVILYLMLIIEVPIALQRYGHMEVNVFHVIGLGWALWLLCCLFQAKLDSIADSLTPRHPLLKGPPRSVDEEAPTQTLLQPCCDKSWSPKHPPDRLSRPCSRSPARPPLH